MPWNLYVIGTPIGPLKIGIAKDVTRRMAELQTGNPEELVIYRAWQVNGERAVLIESELHRRLAQYRVRGEWFSCDVATIEATLVNLEHRLAAALRWCNEDEEHKILYF